MKSVRHVYTQYCPAYRSCLSAILLYLYMSQLQRFVCDCSKRTLYCIVCASVRACSASIAASRSRLTRHTTVTSDELTPRQRHQPTPPPRSRVPSADAALNTPTSLSTTSAHTEVCCRRPPSTTFFVKVDRCANGTLCRPSVVCRLSRFVLCLNGTS